MYIPKRKQKFKQTTSFFFFHRNYSARSTLIQKNSIVPIARDGQFSEIFRSFTFPIVAGTEGKQRVAVRERGRGEDRKEKKKKILGVHGCPVSFPVPLQFYLGQIFFGFSQRRDAHGIEGPRSRGDRRGGLPRSSARCFEPCNLTEWRRVT